MSNLQPVSAFDGIGGFPRANRWAPRDPVAEPVEQADSARYRQLGNSIAGPVFEWAAEGVRLVDEDAKRNRVE